MAAYAALVSIMHIIHNIEHHPSPPISIDKHQLESLTQIVTFLQQFLQGYNSPLAHNDEADPLEMRIAEAAYAAEDVIESHIVDMINLRRFTSQAVHPQEEDDMERYILESIMKQKSANTSSYAGGETSTSAGGETSASAGSNNQSKPMMWSSYFGWLTKPINNGRKVNSIDNLYRGLQKVIKYMNLVKKEAMNIIGQKTAVEARLQRNDVVSASAGSSGSSIMVGFDDVLVEIMDKLTDGQLVCKVIPIVGMGGTGKTTLARHIYAHPFVKEHFDIFGWATISQQYDTREIICELLSQVNKRSKQELSGMSEDELGLALHKYLFNRRFLIVMDDMWSVDAWNIIQRFLPDNENGSRIMVTTRESQLSSQLNNNYCLQMKFLDKVSSWDLFTKTVFGEESCPLELEEIGKEIVDNCRGLPLAIVVVGGLLKKMDHTKGCWESIRKNSSSVVNSANEDFCLKILRMSYSHLPVPLKPCFLYMGVFEEDRAVRVSTLIKLWVSEGFLRPTSGTSLEATAKEYLHDLVHRNLILVHEFGSIGNIKFCKVHDLLRDLCLREAGKEGFYNVIGQQKFQSINRTRRVVIPGSTLKDEVLDAFQSMPLARSFVCHSKEVRALPKSRLMRTLKAYDRDTSGSHNYMLDELFEFVNSRYLAVGVNCEPKMSSFLYYLWNLQTLIIFYSYGVIAPNEIWKMPQLRHIEIHKGLLYLLYPSSGINVIMENLQTLKGVSGFFGYKASTMMPNIKKLGVSDRYTGNLESLTKLESYRCWGIQSLGAGSFANSLKKLSLGSNSSDWKLKKLQLETIGELPLLEKLKLERALFSDKQWETSEEQFPSLKFLELRWCVLESWMTDSSHLPRLEQLHLYALKELEEIPCEIGEISTLQSIHVEYCTEPVVESAKKITEEQDELQARVVLFNTTKNQAMRSLASSNFLVEFVDF